MTRNTKYPQLKCIQSFLNDYFCPQLPYRAKNDNTCLLSGKSLKQQCRVKANVRDRVGDKVRVEHFGETMVNKRIVDLQMLQQLMVYFHYGCALRCV